MVSINYSPISVADQSDDDHTTLTEFWYIQSIYRNFVKQVVLYKKISMRRPTKNVKLNPGAQIW